MGRFFNKITFLSFTFGARLLLIHCVDVDKIFFNKCSLALLFNDEATLMGLLDDQIFLVMVVQFLLR
jgi:hypothetical protein